MIQRRAVAKGAFGGGLAAVGLARQGRAAAQFNLKCGNNLPLTHPLNVRLAQAVARIQHESGGRVAIQVFPNNVLGGDTDMLSQVRVGAIQLFTLSGLILSTVVPVASINGIGFAFKDYSQVWPTMDGALGAYVRAAIAKSGLVAMEKMWDNGFRETTTSTKPIRSPADFHGLKIRVPISPLWTSMFKALGAAPTGINFNEVYSALQTHVVDGEENPLAIISVAKLYEVQKYCSLTNHMWDGFWFLANGRAFHAMPPDLQKIVAAALNDAAVQEREDVKKLNDTLQSDLTAKGMAFNTTDPAPFRDALRKAGFYKHWQAQYGAPAWTLLEKGVGSLA